MTTTNATAVDAELAAAIEAKKTELAEAEKTLTAIADAPVGRPKRGGKQSNIRYDAKLRRAAAQVETVKRLERELKALETRRDNPKAAPVPLDLSRLPFARFIRTDVGWYEVVKVNTKTVKVVVKPGWDDLIKIGKILEIREHVATAAPAPAAPDEDEEEPTQCRTEGCDEDPDNGEGWDGYCGNCADRVSRGEDPEEDDLASEPVFVSGWAEV